MTPERTRRSSAEIRQDIARTRTELDSTVNALGKRLSPAGLFEEGWNFLRSGSAEPHARAGVRTIREHPIPVAMLGVGFGWLAAETAGRSSEQDRQRRLPEGDEGPSIGEPASGTGEKASELAHGVSDRVGEMSDRVSDVSERVGDRVSGMGKRMKGAGDRVTGQATERAREMGGQARNRARRASRGFAHAVEENPMGMGVAAFALAVAAGSMVRATRWENETMGEARDTLLDEAKETGRETVDDVKDVAREAKASGEEKARERGLTPEGLGDRASETARRATEEER